MDVHRAGYDVRVVIVGKKCTACGVFKEINEYCRHPSSPLGRTPKCRPCKAAPDADYRARNRDALEAKRKAQHAANPDLSEAARKRAREWYHANKERARTSARRNYERNRTVRIAAAKAWKEANPERVRAWDRAAREANRDRYRKNGSAYRARLNGAPVVEDVERALIYERDLGLCGICGEFVDRDSYHIDHVIPLARGGSHTWENLQVAHGLCNQRKSARLPSELPRWLPR